MTNKELEMINSALVKSYGKLGNLIFDKLQEYIKILFDS